MKPDFLIGGARVVVALALLGSVAWQVTDRVINDVFRPAEYFAYFSIVSAILVGVIMLVSGIATIRGIPESRRMALLRISAVTSMLVVAIVYHALLENSAPDPRDVGYAWPVLPNLVIHTYAPILVAIDYLFVHRREPLRLRQAFWVVVYPLTWLAFSIVRGLSDGWWPYWFIDPSGPGGVGSMLAYVLAISVFFIVLALVLIALARLSYRLMRRTA
jgi:hypothetical protein